MNKYVHEIPIATPAAMLRDCMGNNSLAYIFGMLIIAAVANRITTIKVTGI